LAQGRPIRFIAPFMDSGGTDVAARLIAECMPEILGRQVVEENRGGSGGEMVAPAATVLRLNPAVRDALATPLVANRMAAAGVDGQSSTAEELAAFIRAEADKRGRVVRDGRIIVD